jgi:predicted Mrr-cat superfamily restriction endonuclease
MSDRPWWVGPVAAGAALFVVYASPESSATAVRSVAGQAWQFVEAVTDGTTLEEVLPNGQ